MQSLLLWRERRADVLRSLRKERFTPLHFFFVVFSYISCYTRDSTWTVVSGHLEPVCDVKTDFLGYAVDWIRMRTKSVWIAWFIRSSFTASKNVSQLSRQINGLKSSGSLDFKSGAISLLNDAHRQTRRHGGETSYFGGSQYDIHSSDCIESKGKGIFLTLLDLFASFELLQNAFVHLWIMLVLVFSWTIKW